MCVYMCSPAGLIPIICEPSSSDEAAPGAVYHGSDTIWTYVYPPAKVVLRTSCNMAGAREGGHIQTSLPQISR